MEMSAVLLKKRKQWSLGGRYIKSLLATDMKFVGCTWGFPRKKKNYRNGIELIASF